MLRRNFAKPFCIAGFILAEIYMLFVVLAPYGHEPSRGLPVPVPFEVGVSAGTPPPPSATVMRVAVAAIFFGPFGALVGLGVGLVFSAVVQGFGGGKVAPGKPPGS